jgi:hypothetical protein
MRCQRSQRRAVRACAVVDLPVRPVPAVGRAQASPAWTFPSLLFGHSCGAGPRAGEDGHMSMATDVVDAQIEAYRARDVERFLLHYADVARSVFSRADR